MRELQEQVGAWAKDTLGESVLQARKERALRVCEEAIELAQAEGIQQFMVTTLLERVYSRTIGVPYQEAAGIGVTLLAWAYAANIDLEHLIKDEIYRISEPEMRKKIREKQNEKAAAGVAMKVGSAYV